VEQCERFTVRAKFTFCYSPGATRYLAVELKTTQSQVVAVVGVLADLDNTEETVAVSSELAVDFSVDLEGH